MQTSVYKHTPETWDAPKCESAAKRVTKDGCGTPYPWPGYIGNNYGTQYYNGGCTRDGAWYEGEHYPLPKVAPGYKIKYVKTWGYRIIKDETK